MGFADCVLLGESPAWVVKVGCGMRLLRVLLLRALPFFSTPGYLLRYF